MHELTLPAELTPDTQLAEATQEKQVKSPRELCYEGLQRVVEGGGITQKEADSHYRAFFPET